MSHFSADPNELEGMTHSISTIHVHRKKAAQGRMHKKRELEYHKCKAPSIRTHSNAKREFTRVKGTNVWILTKDNISHDDSARENCRILAEAEREKITPNLYTQAELKEAEANIWMREQGINPNLFIGGEE